MTSPAPTRNAPYEQSAAAPVMPFEPAITNTLPCLYLCVLISSGSRKQEIDSSIALCQFNPESLSTASSGKPISAICTSPAKKGPCRIAKPSLAHPIVIVKSALTPTGSAIPLSA